MLPLTGIRVVTMALNAPGPVACARLRAEGASVTKIEPPAGDPMEGYCAAWYQSLHEGIPIQRLDLKSAEGSREMRTLLESADLFLASQRPAALARLGLDADTLLSPASRVNHLRWLNIVGELEHPDVAGHDLTYLAKAGLLGREVPQSIFADILAAENTFATALLLLRQPPGTRAQVGLYDTLAPLMDAKRYGLSGPGSLLGGRLPAYGIYDAREGRVAVAALEPHFFRRLYEELGLPSGSALDDAFRGRTSREWERWAEEHDLPINAVAD